jgi:hypothetical protein
MGYALHLDEETVDGQLFVKLKTEGSKGYVALPASLRAGWPNGTNLQAVFGSIVRLSERGGRRIPGR